ncbi:SDR family oxidoreductase [Candidatus Gracilibacteria bacterium]|nr:SDR family oxidoreductase [Candidatus Gracilibacteria bacterium]
MHICITGVSSGIGLHITQKLTPDHTLTGISRRSIENRINLTHIKGDIRDENLLEKIAKESEAFDYIILNAGVAYFDSCENILPEQHREIIETNLLSTILFINVLLKYNKIKKGIIFIGSIAGKKSSQNGSSYAASKFGLRGFAMQLKNEQRQLGIHIINPKIVSTELHKNSKIQIQGKYKETSLESISSTITSILSGEEKRFEIDL